MELHEKVIMPVIPYCEGDTFDNAMPHFTKERVVLYSLDFNTSVTASYNTDGRTGLVNILVTPNSRRR